MNVPKPVAKALGATHRDPLMGEVIAALAAHAGGGADGVVERAEMVKALGPIRLKYMADDAPVDAFRTVQQLVDAIDAAFDEEALRARGK